MPFRQTLDQWSSRPLILGAAIVSEDGLLVHHDLGRHVDGEAVAALSVAVRRHAEQLGTAIGGSLGSTVMELTGGPAVVTPLDTRHTLIVLARPDADLGPLLFDIRRSRSALAGSV